jgi:hypothetical protein
LRADESPGCSTTTHASRECNAGERFAGVVAGVSAGVVAGVSAGVVASVSAGVVAYVVASASAQHLG